eukprot:15454491-Alexandrium_andersonii.AAC.1
MQGIGSEVLALWEERRSNRRPDASRRLATAPDPAVRLLWQLAAALNGTRQLARHWPESLGSEFLG